MGSFLWKAEGTWISAITARWVGIEIPKENTLSWISLPYHHELPSY